LQEMLQEHGIGQWQGHGHYTKSSRMSTVTTGAIKVMAKKWHQFHKCLQENLRALWNEFLQSTHVVPDASTEAVQGDNYYCSAASVSAAKQCKVHIPEPERHITSNNTDHKYSSQTSNKIK